MNLNSLLRAYIDVGPYVVENADYDPNAIHRPSCAMPTFQNLTELKLGDLNIHGWEFLPHLLESAPDLEALVFMRGIVEHEGCFAKFESSILNCVPKCLSLHLRRMYFEEFNGEQDELELVSYFLTTAEVLREVEFSFCFFFAYRETVRYLFEVIAVAKMLKVKVLYDSFRK
ncbi:hypothetical protein RHGRI_018577 [Rhododendron griersonianum]|uniref:FBD domain-containing protein n=1 Tax=Rhododendron griersonianum TaxID=479676 RepID=A0AAV6K233_9ERIC|nr:hypothetical protein RHGRI_018577 [Rhododendron griersonianum]